MKDKIEMFAALCLAVVLFTGCGMQSAGGAEAFVNSRGSGHAPADVEADVLISPEELPDYAGKASVEIHGNVPGFKEEDNTTEPFVKLSEQDELGRCGAAEGCFGPETLAEEERGSIGHIKPSGWHTVKYPDVIEDVYLYNRCHLLMYKLSGILDDERNLITGTRYMNTVGQLPYEEQALRYVESTSNHILYRVTPLYEGDNLLASGVLMEARSVEDDGEGLSYCVYCYNVQPGIILDYATGESRREERPPLENGAESQKAGQTAYILNTHTHKFHVPSCGSVEKIRSYHRLEFLGSREELIGQGYSPCGNCKP